MILPTSAAKALTSRTAEHARADLADQPAGLRGVGEGDALADALAQHRRIVIGQRLDGLAGDRRVRTAAVHDEARQEPPATDRSAPRR